MHSPLGKLTAHSIPQDTQTILFTGEYHGHPFHIYATQPSNPNQLDYPFYIQILNNLPHFIAQAEQQLHTSQRQPENEWNKFQQSQNEQRSPILALPTAQFTQNTHHWALHFAECTLPIGELYGILFTFEQQKIIGWEDLSQADEICD